MLITQREIIKTLKKKYMYNILFYNTIQNLEEITKREERLKNFLQLLQDYRISSKSVKNSMRTHYKVKDNKAKFNVSPLMNMQ